jgi:hypothetical protein
MRKSPPKLALRKETVRMLATMALVHVQGGSNADAAQAIEESTPKQCGATAVAVVAPPGA